jgi:hypothetical protein
VGTLVCLDHASLISSVGKMKIDSAANERACIAALLGGLSSGF